MIPAGVVDAIVVERGDEQSPIMTSGAPRVLDAVLTLDGWWTSDTGTDWDWLAESVAHRISRKDGPFAIRFVGLGGNSLAGVAVVQWKGDAVEVPVPALDRLVYRVGLVLLDSPEALVKLIMSKDEWAHFLKLHGSIGERLRCSSDRIEPTPRLDDTLVLSIRFSRSTGTPSLTHVEGYGQPIGTQWTLLHAMLHLWDWDAARAFASGVASRDCARVDGQGFTYLGGDAGVLVESPVGEVLVGRSAFEAVMLRLFDLLSEDDGGCSDAEWWSGWLEEVAAVRRRIA